MAILEYRLRLLKYTHLTPTVFQLGFEMPKGLVFQGGQFVSVVVPGAAGGRDLRRAYSIASNPENSELEFCIKYVEGGPGTTYLKNLKIGDEIKVFAPYGTFVYKSMPDRDVVFISTGTGIAPFRSMLLSTQLQQSKPRSITLLLGVREESEILYDREFSDIKDLKWIKTVSRPTTTSGSNWVKGRVTDYFKDVNCSVEWLQTDFYLCGNGAMIDEIKKILAEKGVKKESIHQEIYYKPKLGEA